MATVCPFTNCKDNCYYCDLRRKIVYQENNKKRKKSNA